METTTEPGMGRLEIFALEPSEETLLALLEDLFANHWREIVFGTLIQGAVFEIRAPNAPRRIGLLDGYLTIDFASWHFHICIGPHTGSPGGSPVDADLARHRRTARAELYRVLDGEGAPVSWGLRLFNGADEQQLTVFLPNPFLDPDDSIRKEPDWARLALWDRLRAEWLGLPADPRDRSAKGFHHG